MSQHTTREQFLAHIRDALGRKSPLTTPPAPPRVDESIVRLASSQDDLTAMFAERASGVGMNVRKATSAGLATQLLDVLREAEARTVTLAVGRLPEHGSLREALTTAGIEMREWHNERSMAPHYEVDAGISDVHAAIAETGTIVCCPDDEHGRGHSLVPPVHVAIVRVSDIVPDMLDFMAAQRDKAPTDLPSAIAFITGPSKTADIEGILITGVHGPGRVYILLVEDT